VAKFLSAKKLQQDNLVMRKESTIGKLLGMSQQDMAMLLGVSRGQWSMYESGKRDLPLHANQLLADMLTHVRTAETISENRYQSNALQLKGLQQSLEHLLRENEYQQLLLDRKIAAARKKQTAQMRIAQLAHFVNNKEPNTGTASNAAMQFISRKAVQASSNDYHAILVQYEIKKEIVILEKMLIESKIRKIALSIENQKDML